MRGSRGASFVELMVLVGTIALACVATWAMFGDAIRRGAACLGSRILERSGSCGGASDVSFKATSTTQSPAPTLAAEGAVVCAGGQCRGGNCFAAGTRVLTPGGARAIETIREGDLVLSRDVVTGEDRPAPVVGRKVTLSRPTILVGLDDATPIEVTAEHPFWVVGQGWTEAGALAEGATLAAPEGTRVVRSLATSAALRSVYNIEVEGTHTYFAGGVLVHNDCKALVAPTFTIRDLEVAGTSVRDRVLVAYYWLRLPNDERERINRGIREERLRGDDARVGRMLVSRARSAYPLGLPRELDTGVGEGNFDGSLVARQLRFDAHVRHAQAEWQQRVDDFTEEQRTGRRSFRRMFEPKAALPPIFEMPRITEKSPTDGLRNTLAGRWGIDHDTDLRLIADTILEESGVEEKARFEKPDESWGYWAWRNIRDTGKAALWRSGGAFIAPDSLKPEASGEERFRQRLTQEAFDFAAGVDVTRTEQGAVVLRPIDTPASVAALRVLLEPGNLAALDVAAARAAGQIGAKPDGKITREDFDAIARDFRYPEDFRKAAAHFTNPVVESTNIRRPVALFDRFADLDAKDGWTDKQVTPAGMRSMLEAREGGITHQLAPSLHRIFVRHGDGKESTAVDIIDWSKTVGSIHDAELAWLTGRMSTEEFDRFYNVTIAASARKDAAEARLKLDADLDRLTSHGLDGVLAPDFEKDLGTVIKLGELDGKYDQYVNRAWYEKLGVGTWGAVKEVLMVPVGLGELIVYASDHGNPVILIKGRADGMPLLHTLAGQALSDPLGTMDGISNAFDEWWLSAQVEPDRTTGQAVGFVATFFIPFEKVIKVARVSGSIGRTLAMAAEARAAGDLARAERLLGRAKQMTRLLTRMRNAERVGEGGKTLGRAAVPVEQAAREQAAMDKLVSATEDAVTKAETELARVATEARPLAPAPKAMSAEKIPIKHEAAGLARRTDGSLTAAEITKGGVSQADLLAAYPENGRQFFRGMRVQRDASGKLLIMEQRPTEIAGTALQKNINNFSSELATAEHFAATPGGNAFAGTDKVVLVTRPIRRAEALQYFHEGNFDPRIFEDGLSSLDKWDMRADTRLTEVVQEVRVYDDAAKTWRTAKPGEFQWVKAPETRAPAGLGRQLYVLGPKCFAAGTEVLVAEDTDRAVCDERRKMIEDVKVDDVVFTFDEETGERRLSRVSRTMVKSADVAVDLVAREADRAQAIRTTPEHPFFVEGQGWTEAKDLRPGARLRGAHGTALVVEAASIEPLAIPIPVYNLSVAWTHTYYVAASERDEPMLVHNTSCALDDIFAGVWRAEDLATASAIALEDGHKMSEVAEYAARVLREIPGNPATNRKVLMDSLRGFTDADKLVPEFGAAIARGPVDEAAQAAAKWEQTIEKALFDRHGNKHLKATTEAQAKSMSAPAGAPSQYLPEFRGDEARRLLESRGLRDGQKIVHSPSTDYYFLDAGKTVGFDGGKPARFVRVEIANGKVVHSHPVVFENLPPAVQRVLGN